MSRTSISLIAATLIALALAGTQDARTDSPRPAPVSPIAPATAVTG